MPKDFDSDVEQDLSFTIGGENFKMRYVRPEVLAKWEDEPTDEKSEEVLKRQDLRIVEFLEGEDASEKWMKLRAREKDAVPLVKINELLRWMVEVQTSRPTSPPSPSVAGRGRTAPSSRAA